MDDPLIADLRQQIANGQAIAIIGAGLSIGVTKNAPTASWVGLLKNGVARCEAVANPRPSSGWGDRQGAALDGGDLDDLLAVAEHVSRKLGYPDGGEWPRWLRETVGMPRANEPAVLEAVLPARHALGDAAGGVLRRQGPRREAHARRGKRAAALRA